jgi:hypothetical protein
MAFDCAEPNPEAEERLCSRVPRMCVHVLGTQSVPVGKEGSYTCGKLLWGMSGNEVVAFRESPTCVAGLACARLVPTCESVACGVTRTQWVS